MQIKLLRVLQERSFYRLGGAKEVSVNVRVIAATNRKFGRMVEGKNSCEDLFFRLNVGTVMMPPLNGNGISGMNLKNSGKRIGGFLPIDALGHRVERETSAKCEMPLNVLLYFGVGRK